MTDTNEPTCSCRLGFKCPTHQRCGNEFSDHDWTRHEPFIQDLANGHVRRVTTYSCDDCDWHSSDVYYLTQDEIDELVSA